MTARSVMVTVIALRRSSVGEKDARGRASEVIFGVMPMPQRMKEPDRA